MAWYRKVDTRIWNDEKFVGLSDNGKLAFLFLMTHPHMTSLGAMRSTLPGLAAELGWLPEAFTEAFAEALAKGMVEHDPRACYVGLPNFLKYNGPESPNVVKSWAESLDLVPECDLKRLLIQRVKAFTEGLTEGFSKALPKAFAKSMPNQEQEQEQEQEHKQDPSSSSFLRAPTSNGASGSNGIPVLTLTSDALKNLKDGDGSLRAVDWDEALIPCREIVAAVGRSDAPSDRELVAKIAALEQLGAISQHERCDACVAVTKKAEKEPGLKRYAYLHAVLTSKLKERQVAFNALLAAVTVPEELVHVTPERKLRA